MKRSDRLRIAEETIQIIERQHYLVSHAGRIDLSRLLDQSVAQTTLHRPAELVQLNESKSIGNCTTRIEVVNQTTMEAGRRVTRELGAPVACLNFASAKNPGGGFLTGSSAQEESLARSSGLYPCLLAAEEYYAANRRCGTAFYTDHMIHSPCVPFFRDDEGALLAEPWSMSVITAPAVNAGVIREQESAQVPQIREAMRRRIDYVLALARHHSHRHLILGAWGCGVFRNDPHQIAGLFAESLLESGRFARDFESVVFAVYDGSSDSSIFGPFADRFTKK